MSSVAGLFEAGFHGKCHLFHISISYFFVSFVPLVVNPLTFPTCLEEASHRISATQRYSSSGEIPALPKCLIFFLVASRMMATNRSAWGERNLPLRITRP